MHEYKKRITSWSELNVQPKFRTFDVDYKEFSTGVRTANYVDDPIGLLNLIAIDAEENPERPDIVRRRRLKMKPAYTRLAFPIDGGYTTYREALTGRFYCDLFNLCQEHGIFEPKLLINHALMQPWWPSIYYDSDYTFSFKINETVAEMFHKYVEYSISISNIEDIKFYMHKNTTPGPPFTCYNGVQYGKNDIYYGLSDDMDLSMITALRKDYTSVKQTFLAKINEIHDAQVYFSDPRTWGELRKNWLKYYYMGVLPFAVEGGRLNSTDGVINIEPGQKANIKTFYYTKQRFFNVFKPNHVVMGKILIEKLTQYLQNLSRAGWLGGLARPRGVVNDSWPSQQSGSISTKMITHHIENGPNGFARTEDISIKGYRNFLEHCRSIGGGKFIFLNGDRTNAETTVTSNFDEFKKLIHPKLRQLYDFQNSVYMVSDIPYWFNGLPSGMARTTEINWYAGTYEAIYTISELLETDIVTVAKNYFNSLVKEVPYFEINNYVIKLFMCTDDIPLIIYGDISSIHLERLERAKSRMMKWEVSYKDMRTFGMYFTDTHMEASQSSIISKLFYSEHPGFFVKDCFSLVSKLDMLEKSLRQDVLNLIKKYYNTDYGYYLDASKAFLGWLSEFGIPISSVINQYSPANRVLYGSMVEGDPISKSARVPYEYFKGVFNWYKNIMR